MVKRKLRNRKPASSPFFDDESPEDMAMIFDDKHFLTKELFMQSLNLIGSGVFSQTDL